jgi:choline-sulfatase
MSRKNLVVIMSDEHNPTYMGCSGHAFVRTPNLDALARRGMSFPSAYTPSPICVPARAAFATGMRVHRTRHWDNASPYTGTPPSWGHVLQQRQIRVESVGKLHYRNEIDDVGFDAEHLPMHVVGGHGMVWGSIRDPILPIGDGKRMLGENIGPGESPYTEYDRAVTDKAVDWLRQAAADDRPFVLYVGLVAPHFPLTAPPEFFKLYEDLEVPEAKLHPDSGATRHPWVETYAHCIPNEERFRSATERANAFRAYYALCSFLDDNVGKIISALDATGLSDTTHVIYTSDHGDNVGARGLWGKSTLYQETVRVPMILAGPRTASGFTSDVSVDLLDVYPTILDVCGLAWQGHMEERPGHSLLDVGNVPNSASRVIMSEYHATGSNTAGFMLRKGKWKYHYYVRFAPELFDLESDPEELNDLAQRPEHASIVAEMEQELRRICDPEFVDMQAKQDQTAFIESLGGRDVAANLGVRGATPPPKASIAE